MWASTAWHEGLNLSMVRRDFSDVYSLKITRSCDSIPQLISIHISCRIIYIYIIYIRMYIYIQYALIITYVAGQIQIPGVDY